jgi:hypothetical protein
VFAISLSSLKEMLSILHFSNHSSFQAISSLETSLTLIIESMFAQGTLVGFEI